MHTSSQGQKKRRSLANPSDRPDSTEQHCERAEASRGEVCGFHFHTFLSEDVDTHMENLEGESGN